MKFLIAELVLLVLPRPAHAQKFLRDDPVWHDSDRLPFSTPRSVELSQIYDFLENTFVRRSGPGIPPAPNINTLGEVPDSSWFTNRMSINKMSIEELVRGPNQIEGPDVRQPWVIIRAKSEGISPGFTIRDGRGDVFLIKFDPLSNPQLATSTEVICTKFFHAFGYHVPENYLTFMDPRNLWVDPEAEITDETGTKRKMTPEDVQTILEKVPVRADGAVQAIASRRLPGKPLGPFKYFGTREDDPNDIFPHEDRRELRGLRVFAAWLNHDDARSINSLDMFASQGKTGYVKHHLLDFGSCLGSGSVKVQSRRAGNEYILEWGPILRAALTAGLWARGWQHVDYPEYPAVGRFEADFFGPERWKPEYPNPAFERMQMDDALWATRMVMRFTDEMIRAMVRTGRIDNPEAENYLAQTLIRRRDKIIRYYPAQINPLVDFQAAEEKSSLEFVNLGLEAGLGSVESYRYHWFRFDNDKMTSEPLGDVLSTSRPSIPIPRDGAAFLLVRIQTLSPQHPAWKKKVDVYIRNGLKQTVVGIERER